MQILRFESINQKQKVCRFSLRKRKKKKKNENVKMLEENHVGKSMVLSNSQIFNIKLVVWISQSILWHLWLTFLLLYNLWKFKGKESEREIERERVKSVSERERKKKKLFFRIRNPKRRAGKKSSKRKGRKEEEKKQHKIGIFWYFSQSYDN